MKLTKIFAGMAASVIAVSCFAMSASAAEAAEEAVTAKFNMILITTDIEVDGSDEDDDGVAFAQVGEHEVKCKNVTLTCGSNTYEVAIAPFNTQSGYLQFQVVNVWNKDIDNPNVDYIPGEGERLSIDFELEDADGTATNCSMYPRDYAGSDPYEICQKDGTYLPAVSLNLYLYNMHEPSCQLPHDKRNWFGSEGGLAYRGAKEGGQSTSYLYYGARPYWWGEFCEPLYEPWYTEKVRYLYAYADHPVTVRNPESFMVIIDDIDLEQAENGDPNNIVTYNKNRGLFKDLSAEEIHAMLPIKLEGGDVCEWTSWNSDGWIDSLFTKTGGHIYCVCEYSDGTKEYYHSTPLDIGCTVTLNGMGTYKASASDGADPITQILGLDDFSLEDAKKALPYKLRTGMDSYSALLAAEKLKKLGLEVDVSLDGAEKVKTWTVILESYDTERELDSVKALRTALEDCGEPVPSLAEAKTMLNSAPSVIKEGLTKAQAISLTDALNTALASSGIKVIYK